MTRWERLIFLLFGVIGVALVLWGAGLAYLSLASIHWPTVPGTITQATVRHASGSVDPAQAPTTTHAAVIRYAYLVNDQAYAGSTIAFGYFYSSSDGAAVADYLQKYPEGKTVRVFYDPAAPGRSVLEPGLTPSVLIVLGIGGVLASIGLLLPAAIHRSARTEQRPRVGAR